MQMPNYSELSDEEEQEQAEAAGPEVPEEEEEYEVEAIVDKRVKKGVVEYFVKWKGWPSDTNTWEGLDNLENSGELIDEYENNLEIVKLDAKKDERMRRNPDLKPDGFARGLVAEKVVGATFDTGRITFKVKWRDTEDTDIVSGR